MRKVFSDKAILKKAEALVRVYKSIRRAGYCKGKFRQSIITVLAEPFENIRFNYRHELPGYEIWSGHARASSLYVLGFHEIEVMLLEPVGKETGQESDQA